MLSALGTSRFSTEVHFQGGFSGWKLVTNSKGKILIKQYGAIPTKNR